MINRNAIAYSFITDEECLNLCSEEENLNMLLGITLFRDDYDREPLKKEEIKILKDSYNIIYEENDNEPIYVINKANDIFTIAEETSNYMSNKKSEEGNKSINALNYIVVPFTTEEINKFKKAKDRKRWIIKRLETSFKVK